MATRRHPRQIANALKDTINRLDRDHPELRGETEGLRSASSDAIGFLQAFARLADELGGAFED